jgi:hypothetical protein
LFCFILAVLEFEFRASYLLGRNSIIWAMPLVLFALVIFGDRVSLFAQASLDHNPPILSFPCWLDDRCRPPCPAFICLDRVSKTFCCCCCQAGLEPPDLSFPSSLDYRHEPPAPR